MNTPKHTSGKWKVNALDRKGLYQVGDSKTLISTDTALGNARLIAAAPEMYELLVKILESPDSVKRTEIETLVKRATGVI